ncbi:AMP-dependent synthetase/ligase [Chamaesiphon minutus]|uniref:AMP-forming long-chain acyl-CoA synthetase n=1 Tax=Chamaesiphon minutus (strain ATCC 27169 / PCC 6605) TaxID=1173020 RepID=K9UH05_CHAP6|nr:AMP-binding protein [Chamaesiphon minutus]AFY94095.1 AMP-forming long-chain acyl-CoA synthetase [Chamaesiphon minutus PCC 6605]
MTTARLANYPYTISQQEAQNISQTIDYTQINSLPEVWPIVAAKCGDTVALNAPHSKPAISMTYREVATQIKLFATGLQSLGIKPQTGVALFADNSPRWLIADQGIMTTGAFNAVRSSQAEVQELLSILDNSQAQTLVVEDLKTLNKLSDRLADLPIKLIILLCDETTDVELPIKLLNFSQTIDLGRSAQFQPATIAKTDLATLIYTSGTSGNPKGVMLTHANLLHQINTCGTVIPATPGSRVLSILPSWHSYERSCEYYLLSQGCTQTYTNIRYFKQDLKEYQPEYLVAVPRLSESIYEGIQKQFREQPPNKQKLVARLLALSTKYIEARRIVQGLSLECLNPTLGQKLIARLQMAILAPIHAIADKLIYSKIRAATGGKIRYIISGGGSLAKHLDLFFEIIGVNILVGYGLTETAPITNVRRPWQNLRLSSGQPLPGTEIRIVDVDTRQPVAIGQKGLVMIRGPQVMQGYYRDPEATAKAIDVDGWFNSGDLGMLTPNNDLTITGRAKDTIVLSNGENIEPTPIEDACLRSSYISQIVLVGQDQKALGALIVPNSEALHQWAISQNLIPAPIAATNPASSNEPNILLDNPQILNNTQVIDLFRDELNREVKNRPGYRIDDRIATIKLIAEPFSIENGLLTQTLKIRRPVVMARYHGMIDEMFAR